MAHELSGSQTIDGQHYLVSKTGQVLEGPFPTPEAADERSKRRSFMQGLPRDPEFLALPFEERRKVIRQLDPAFGGLPKPEQDKVITALSPAQELGAGARYEQKYGPQIQQVLEQAGPLAATALKTFGTLGEAIKVPHEYIKGALAGKPGQRIESIQEVTGLQPESVQGVSPGDVIFNPLGSILSHPKLSANLAADIATDPLNIALAAPSAVRSLRGAIERVPSFKTEELGAIPSEIQMPSVGPVGKELDKVRYQEQATSLHDVLAANPRVAEAKAKLAVLEKEPPIKFLDEKGQVLPERQAAHQQAFAGMVNPLAATQPGQRPKAVIIIGPPASGKTEVLNPMIEGEFSRLDADKALPFLPEYQRVAPIVGPLHEEAAYIVEKEAFPTLVRKSHNIVLDMVGKSPDKIRKMAEKLKKGGYDSELFSVKADPFLSAERATQRYLRGGRYVDDNYILKDVAFGPDRTYNELRNDPLFTGGAQYGNTGRRAPGQEARGEVTLLDAWGTQAGPHGRGVAGGRDLASTGDVGGRRVPTRPAGPSVESPPGIVPPAIAGGAEILPPSPLTTTVLSNAATKEVATAAKASAEQLLRSEATEPGKRIYHRIMDLMDRGELDLPSIPGVLQRTGQPMSAFIKEYGKTYPKSARDLNYLSQVRKALDRQAANNPELRAALAEFDKASPPIEATAWTKIKDVYRTVDDVRRASLTAQLATSVRNIISQTGRYTLEAVDQAVQGLIQGRGLGNAPELVAALVRKFSKADRATVDYLLQRFPVEQARLIATPTGEVTLGTRYAKLVNTVNIIQEQFFRRAAFDATVRGELTKRGINVQDALAQPGTIPHDIIELAADRAMELTFAAGPKAGTFGRAIMDAYRAVPMLTTINAFPRFLANGYKYLIDFSPAGYLRLLKPGKTPEFTAEVLSRASLGTAMLAAAGAARELAGGAKWYELQVGNQKVDTRPFAPFSTYLFMYEAMKIISLVGLDMIKDGKSLERALLDRGGMTTGDIVQGMLSINRIAGTGLVGLDLIKAGAFDRKMDLLRDFLAQYLGGFTVPFRTIKDFMAGLSPEEAKFRDVRENIAAPALGNVPLASQTLPEAPSPLRADQPVTEHPWLRQTTGLSIRESRPVEDELARLGVEFSQVNPRTGDAEVDREIAKRMGQAVGQGWLQTVMQSRQYQALSPAQRRLVLLGAGPYGSGILTGIRRQAYQATMAARPDLAARMGLKRLPGTVKDLAIEEGLLQER